MKILYFAPIPYDGLKQRPQYIAEQLAQQHEIFYVDPTVSMMKYLLKGGMSCKGMKYEVTPNLHVLRLNGAVTMHRSLEALDLFHLNVISERRQLKKLINTCDAVWIGYCGWYNVISNVDGKKIIYDKMDDDAQITQNTLLRKLILKVEPKLIQKSNCIFVTTQQFYEQIKVQNSHTWLVPNAVCQNMDCPQEKPFNSEKRVFGYVGMISHWFDFEAIRVILDADENNFVVLVGPSEQPKMEHKRISYIGRVPKEKLPELMTTFDVCLYPFKQTLFLDCIDAVKIYEYLAMNKPVLAVKSRETEKFEKNLCLYDSYGDLMKKCNEKLSLPFYNEEERIKFIKQNCWESRVDIITEKI